MRLLLAVAAALAATPAAAVPKRPLLVASVGLGVADGPSDAVTSPADGAWAAAEYVLRPSSWFTPRAYGGVLWASGGATCAPVPSPCELSARMIFGGLKARIMAPIPYVAPFVEVGLGGSLGRWVTRVGRAEDLSQSGVAYHVPIGVGVALGEDHRFELSFQYLDHPRQHQTVGAIAVGFGFEL